MTGKDFPASNDLFDPHIPKVAFKRLEVVDQEIHARTKETIVGVGKTCSEFYDNNLHRMGECRSWDSACYELRATGTDLK